MCATYVHAFPIDIWKKPSKDSFEAEKIPKTATYRHIDGRTSNPGLSGPLF
jgi:hypothetical protein